MNTELLQSIYAAKEARRKVLSNLSIDERVAIIEKLRDMAVALKEARGNSEGAVCVSPSKPGSLFNDVPATQVMH